MAKDWNWLAFEINRKGLLSAVEYMFGRLLDIGCGDKPYETIVSSHITKYVGIENPGSKGNIRYDIEADAQCLPIGDGTIDTVLCLQVMEHVEDPRRMLSEIHRVLGKPDRYLILTTPFMWGIHEAPRDYFRYTKFGLYLLLEEAGFEVVKIIPQCGYWATASLKLTYYLHRRKLFRIMPVSYILDLTQLVGRLLDRIDFDEIEAGSYLSIAKT